MDSQIYIIPSSDKPVRFVIENQCDTSIETVIYKKTLYNVLKDELKFNYKLRSNLTKQQIHTERGKLKHGRFEEVINFLTKRGVSREYIANEVNQEREDIVVSTKFNIPIGAISNSKFGVIKLN